jgi:tudor domain-containing protein 3
MAHFSGIILQISKLRNVSAPKSNEDSKAAPRMLKITLTDGKKSCNAIEMSKLDGVSLEKTMPGVKVKLSKDVSVSSGYLLLETGSLTVIGGHVEALAKKWQMKTEVWTREQVH